MVVMPGYGTRHGVLRMQDMAAEPGSNVFFEERQCTLNTNS
jgi:hypothetical protein